MGNSGITSERRRAYRWTCPECGHENLVDPKHLPAENADCRECGCTVDLEKGDT